MYNNKEVEIKIISEQNISEICEIENSEENAADGQNINLQIARNFAVQLDNSTGIVGNAVQGTGGAMIAIGFIGAGFSEAAAIAIVPTLGAAVIGELAAGVGSTLTTTIITQSSLAAIGGGLVGGIAEAGLTGGVVGAAVGTVGVMAISTAGAVVVAGAAVFVAYKLYQYHQDCKDKIAKTLCYNVLMWGIRNLQLDTPLRPRPDFDPEIIEKGEFKNFKPSFNAIMFYFMGVFIPMVDCALIGFQQENTQNGETAMDQIRYAKSKLSEREKILSGGKNSPVHHFIEYIRNNSFFPSLSYIVLSSFQIEILSSSQMESLNGYIRNTPKEKLHYQHDCMIAFTFQILETAIQTLNQDKYEIPAESKAKLFLYAKNKDWGWTDDLVQHRLSDGTRVCKYTKTETQKNYEVRIGESLADDNTDWNFRSNEYKYQSQRRESLAIM